MPHRSLCLVTAQEPRFMRVQHGDMDGKWLTVWLRISLTRLRPGQVGRPPPGGSARRPGEDCGRRSTSFSGTGSSSPGSGRGSGSPGSGSPGRDSPDSGSGSPGSGSPGSGSSDSGSPGSSGPGSSVGAGTGDGSPFGDGPTGPCPADDWRCAPSPGGGRRRRRCRDTDRYAPVRHQAAC